MSASGRICLVLFTLHNSHLHCRTVSAGLLCKTTVSMHCCCFQALATAGSILTSGYERLQKCQEAVSATRHTSADFHHELLRLRQHWRLKKVGSTIIGDLSYKSGTSLFVHFFFVV